MADGTHTPKPIVRPEDDPRRRREFLVQEPLRAAARLQKALALDEVGYRHVMGHGHADARAYLLYGGLDEVMKASIAGLRWLELLEDKEAGEDTPGTEPVRPVKREDSRDQHGKRLLLESVIDEQEMWARKLVEIAVDLVLFRGTNEQDVFRLYLIGRQLDAYVGLQRDFQEFYGCQNRNAESTIGLLLGMVDELRGRVDVGRVWFIRDGQDLRRAPRAGGTFRTVRQRFLQALAAAPPELRLTLGGNYEMGYSAPSRSVHSNVGGPMRELTKAEIERNVSRIGLLGLHVVLLAHDLAGIEPAGDTKGIAEAIRESDAAEMYRQKFQREFEIGDIVFAYGDDLCQITGVTTSDYGYTSYTVRYLGRPSIEGIDEDSFPGEYVRLLYRRRDIKPEMIERIRQAGASDERIADIEQLDDASAAEVLARTFVHLEMQGVLAMMLRRREEQGGEDALRKLSEEVPQRAPIWPESGLI